jgi:serine/threonine protein kinase
LPALRGKKDFIEIGTLGSGTSGVVSEAIHVPSLTIVALKMLPDYNAEKRQHVSRELNVLYKNLTELQLINDTLSTDNKNNNTNKNHHENQNEEEENNINTPSEKNSTRSTTTTTSTKSSRVCENILSLYNAFLDPKSGMINLVVEYMDGGSLEDLVKQGGCSDERVVADIAYQTINGLKFLHDNKHVHRDIKPANILCSSNGVIKIADFGISKALKNSFSFAKSFVGTVCYMSP